MLDEAKNRTTLKSLLKVSHWFAYKLLQRSTALVSRSRQIFEHEFVDFEMTGAAETLPILAVYINNRYVDL